MFYGAIVTNLSARRVYVHKILKGAKPSDIPVEQPKKFAWIINLKAAKQIGLMIPPYVLASESGDQIIRKKQSGDC